MSYFMEAKEGFPKDGAGPEKSLRIQAVLSPDLSPLLSPEVFA